MFRVLGKDTFRIYAEGTREDCFKYLHEEYPTYVEDDNNRRHGGIKAPNAIYPEPLQVVRVAK